MAVKIRLQRRGRNKLPQYDIVAADSRSARDKKFLEKLGYYHPLARGEEKRFVLNEEALTTWVGKGAQVTDVVARLLVKENVGPEKVRTAYQAQKARRIKAQEVIAKTKAAKEAKVAAKEAAANPPAEEAPAAEAAAPEASAEEAATEAPAEAPAEEAPAAPAEEPKPEQPAA